MVKQTAGCGFEPCQLFAVIYPRFSESSGCAALQIFLVKMDPKLCMLKPDKFKKMSLTWDLGVPDPNKCLTRDLDLEGRIQH